MIYSDEWRTASPKAIVYEKEKTGKLALTNDNRPKTNAIAAFEILRNKAY